MKALILSLLLLLSTHASAKDSTALTFSLRTMLGASVRLDHPISERINLLEEVGVSAWTLGAGPVGPPANFFRAHAKLGADYTFPSEGKGRWVLGPRVVGARFIYTDSSFDPINEVAVQGTFGRKWDAGKLRFQVGGGLGLHTLLQSGEVETFPMPHVDIRLGPVFRKRS